LFRDMAAQQGVAEGLFAVSDYPLHAAVLRGRGAARTVNAVLVSENYFDLLGVAARAGRTFGPRQARPAAVISGRFREREFAGADPLGQTLQVNNAMVTIVGIAPAGFQGEKQGNAPDLWLPMSVAPLAMANDWLNAPKAAWLTVIARLRPD